MPTSSTVVSAARFVLEMSALPGAITFTDLVGIGTSAPPPSSNSKQFATNQTAEPASVSLRRSLDVDGNKALFAWHNAARNGSPDARCDGTLSLYDAGGKVAVRYLVRGGWCAGLTVGGVRSGDSTVATIEVTILCDSITPG